ncbi:hypothetical protein Tco_0868829 [Tanacetum coccineum]
MIGGCIRLGLFVFSLKSLAKEERTFLFVQDCPRWKKLNPSFYFDLDTLKTDTSDIEAMVTEMFQALKGSSFSTPSGSTPMPTTTPTKVNAHVGGRTLQMSSIKVHLWQVLKRSGGSSFITLKADKNKGIAKETNESPPNLVKALKKVHPNLDAPVLIDYMIDGKMVKITSDKL